MRLFKMESTNFKVDQSIFTGETKPTNKEVCIVSKKEVVIIDKINMLFSGSLVVYGSGICVVC